MTWTIRSVLAWAKDYLQDKGIDTPRLDAEVLLSHALGKERIQLYLDMDRPLSPDELAAYRVLLKRRSGREPVAYSPEARNSTPYLSGEPRYSHSPRRDGNSWKGDRLAPRTARSSSWAWAQVRIISILLSRPDLADSGTTPARLTAGNARLHGVSPRIHLYLGADFRAFPGVFRIVANPPYIALADAGRLRRRLSARTKEALFAGNDGLDVIRGVLPRCTGTLSRAAGLLKLDMARGMR